MPVRSKRAAGGPAGSVSAPQQDRPGHFRAAESTATGRWLVLGKDGRLTAYALGVEGVLRWTEARPGGPEWTGPELLPVPGLTDLSLAQGDHGFVHFVGRRVRQDGTGQTGQVVDVVCATQFQTGRPLTEWRSLGNPDKDSDKAAGLGAPTLAVTGTGLVHALVRNGAGSLFLRAEGRGGKWEGWKDLKLRRTQDGAAAVTTASGRTELLVPGAGLTHRLVRDASDGAYRQDHDIPFAHRPGTATALETAQDRVTYYWTDESMGGLVAYRPGMWSIPLGGAAPTGPVSLLRTLLDGYDCTVLVHRAPDGQVMLTACATENEAGGVWWSPTGDRCLGTPALAHDAYGRVVLALIGPDGALHVSRQSGGPSLVMEPSVRV
ncbi:hypothetical protein ACIRSU_30925 [Streptomyces sp. NPDC101160]|uniref:hypothetical protein n=1 Tax=Streptomyces sp. NPDC101160 TaxID=3366118 RepID=UPI0037FF8D08